MSKKESEDFKERQNANPGFKGGRPPATRALIRMKRLQEVALEVFLEFGYDDARLSEIVKRAGASKETLYAQYENKEQLFLAVTKRVIELPNPLFDELFLQRSTSLEMALKDFAFKWLTDVMHEDRQSLICLIGSETRRFPSIGQLFWEARHVRHQIKLADFFRIEIAKGNLRDGDPRSMACQFLDLAFLEIIIKIMFGVQAPMTATERRARADSAVQTFFSLYGPIF